MVSIHDPSNGVINASSYLDSLVSAVCNHSLSYTQLKCNAIKDYLRG